MIRHLIAALSAGAALLLTSAASAEALFGISASTDPGTLADCRKIAGLFNFACRTPESDKFFPGFQVSHYPPQGVCGFRATARVDVADGGRAALELFRSFGGYLDKNLGPTTALAGQLREHIDKHPTDWVDSVARTELRSIRDTRFYDDKTRPDRLRVVHWGIEREEREVQDHAPVRLQLTVMFADRAGVCLPPVE